MQWGHIKTLFILSFLFLNIYLIWALIDRQQDVGYLDNQELPIEDQLAAEEIKYDSIEVDVSQSAYISAIQKELTDEDLQELEDAQGQESEVINNNLIFAEFETPVRLSQNISVEELETLIQTNFLHGEEYYFWDYNEELNVLIFFQEKEERVVYYNENGLLLIFLNDDQQATHYAQTILGESEVQGDLVQLNQPTQVIYQLFNANYLNRGDEITDMEIGYYSRIAADGIQVFAPTWKVTVNDERSHFVNAIEGIIYKNEQREFLLNMIQEYVGHLHALDDENPLKDSMLPALERRLETNNRSETE